MAEANITMVMRSVYLPPEMDSDLRRLAFQLRLSKADLIRAFVAEGMRAVQHRLGTNPEDAAIQQEAEALGNWKLPAKEVQIADAAMERMQSAVAQSGRSYASS